MPVYGPIMTWYSKERLSLIVCGGRTSRPSRLRREFHCAEHIRRTERPLGRRPGRYTPD